MCNVRPRDDVVGLEEGSDEGEEEEGD